MLWMTEEQLIRELNSIKSRLHKLEANKFDPDDYEGVSIPWNGDIDEPGRTRVKIYKKIQQKKCPFCGYHIEYTEK